MNYYEMREQPSIYLRSSICSSGAVVQNKICNKLLSEIYYTQGIVLTQYGVNVAIFQYHEGIE